jgi:hypothetical protein
MAARRQPGGLQVVAGDLGDQSGVTLGLGGVFADEDFQAGDGGHAA